MYEPAIDFNGFDVNRDRPLFGMIVINRPGPEEKDYFFLNYPTDDAKGKLCFLNRRRRVVGKTADTGAPIFGDVVESATRPPLGTAITCRQSWTRSKASAWALQSELDAAPVIDIIDENVEDVA